MYGCRAREFNDRSPPWFWCSVARKSRTGREGKNYDDYAWRGVLQNDTRNCYSYNFFPPKFFCNHYSDHSN